MVSAWDSQWTPVPPQDLPRLIAPIAACGVPAAMAVRFDRTEPTVGRWWAPAAGAVDAVTVAPCSFTKHRTRSE